MEKTEPIAKSLYVIGTPIGNLGDLSPRAQAILQKVSLIACEDTRYSGQLLKKLSIKNNLISFHKHNTKSRIPKLLGFLEEGSSIGLISDAGLPGISDPGEELVNAAKIEGYKVFCIPGPCAATTALASSGLPSNRFCFEGFLPLKRKDREKALLSITSEERTTVIYESPHRLLRLLQELLELCGSERPLQVARELTKKHEEQIGSNIGDVLKHFQQIKPKGEFTIILGGLTPKTDDKKAVDNSQLLKRMNSLIKKGASASYAAKEVSKETGLPKKFLYTILHEMPNTSSDLDNMQSQ
nr:MULTISPECIES: 16S rRNA (cytidine(1402)-2'-O)-methyltransferase [Prochlorococcus]